MDVEPEALAYLRMVEAKIGKRLRLKKWRLSIMMDFPKIGQY